MSDFDITNVENLEVDNNITLTAGGGNEGKIIFSNDSTNTYIQANATNTNLEDLEIHAQNDLLLRPQDNVGIGTITPTEKLTVSGKILTIGASSDIQSARDVILADSIRHTGDLNTRISLRS